MKFYSVKDVMQITGTSESKSYQFIRQMNEELKAKGYLTVRGKVPAKYFNERFYGAEGKTDECA